MPNQTTYDEVPYTSHSFPQTHPDRLATLGHLFGMSPKPVTQCRVLELGCASGGNLIPMAYHLPGSEFVGIDLSARQVQDAQTAISEIGLNNIKAEHVSILDIDRSWGVFDYVICHGVYSWVSNEVQEKILSIASENLAPQGIAYVSYNVFPGWHMRGMVRHMMRYHASQFDDTHKRIEQARALIDFLSNSTPTNDYFGAMLKNELELVQRSADSYVFHEHLEEVNEPLYFHQFIQRCECHGLQYLAEAEFATMLASGYPEEVSETLERISPDIIRKEQYMDFLRSRYFRQTLLCHSDLALKRNIATGDLVGLLVSSEAQPENSPVDLTPDIIQTFSTAKGQKINTAYPYTKAAFQILSQRWPASVSIDSLLNECVEKIGLPNNNENATLDQIHDIVLQDLLHSYSVNIVEMHSWQTPIQINVTDHPKISCMARYYAKQGNLTINQRHETIPLDSLGKELAPLLDGTQSNEDLLLYIKQKIKNGTLKMQHNGETVTDDELANEAIEQSVKQTLEKLARTALFEY